MKFFALPVVAGIIAAVLLHWIAPSHMPHFAALAAGALPLPLAGFILTALLAVFVDADYETAAWGMVVGGICYAVAISLLAPAPSASMAVVGACLVVFAMLVGLIGGMFCESFCASAISPWSDAESDLDSDMEEMPAAA